jgi:hypothetical protein
MKIIEHGVTLLPRSNSYTLWSILPNMWIALLFALLFLTLAGCSTHLEQQKPQQATQQHSSTDSSATLSSNIVQTPISVPKRIAILPLQGDDQNMMGKDLAVRLYARGYQVIDYDQVEAYYRQAGSIQAVLDRFQLSAVVTGRVYWHDLDALIASNTLMEASLSLAGRKGRQQNFEIVTIAQSEFNTSILSGGVGAVASLAGLVWSKGSELAGYRKEEKKRLFSMMLADKQANNFPLQQQNRQWQWAKTVQVLQGHKPGQDAYYGHRSKLVLIARSSAEQPPQGVEMEARIGGSLTVPLIEQQSGYWRGVHRLLQEGVLLKDQPIELYVQHNGVQQLVGRKGLLTIDTVKPHFVSSPTTFIQNSIDTYLQMKIAAMEQEDQLRIERKSDGKWKGIEHRQRSRKMEQEGVTENSLSIPTCTAATAPLYRAVVSDQAGNLEQSQPFIINPAAGCYEVTQHNPVWRTPRKSPVPLCIDPARKKVTDDHCSALSNIQWQSTPGGVVDGLSYQCSTNSRKVLEQWRLRYNSQRKQWRGEMMQVRRGVEKRYSVTARLPEMAGCEEVY